MIEKRPDFVRPSTVVEVYYDSEFDEHVFVHADGSSRRQPHDRETDNIAGAYMAWLHAANETLGLYRSAYERAVERFAQGASNG